MPRIYQGAFSAGEMSPAMWGRVDLERYRAGLRIARNMFPLVEGGITKRPGLQFVGLAIDTVEAEEVRLLPFSFNNEQTYIIVAEPSKISFIKDGGFILYDMDTPRGGGPIAGSPAVVKGANTVVNWTDHTYVVGDILFWKKGGLIELQNRWIQVTSVVANVSFTIKDYPVNFDINSTDYTVDATAIDFGQIYYLDFTTDGWFDDVDVSELDFTGANDLLYIAHPSEPTKVLTRGATHNSWSLEDFNPAPITVTPTSLIEDTGATPTKPAGTEQILYAVTALDNDTKEESLAALVTIEDTDPLLLVPDTTGASTHIQWDHMAGSDKYRVYKAIAGLYGIVAHVEGTSDAEMKYADGGVVSNLSIAPPLEVSPAFDATDDYPAVVELFQQRIWFGRTNDLLRDIYASRAGSLFSFANSGVTTDDDPIEQAISGKSVQEVRYIVPLRKLVILTSDAEWEFDTGDQGAISPSAGLIADSFWGCARVKPVVIGDSAIFVEKSERQIRDLAYALQKNGFASTDVSIFVKHLFSGRTVVSMCFAQNPYQILFCVMSDGKAISCTYVADQQIFAWARHDTDGRMLDCESITEGGLDNIYVVVKRAIGDFSSSRIQIERMVMALPDFSDQVVYLDNSVESNLPTPTDRDGFLKILEIDNDLLRVSAEEFGAGDKLIRVSFDDGSSASRLDKISIFGEDGGSSGGPGNDRWVNLKRSINGTSVGSVYFNWDGFFPERFVDTDVVGSYKFAITAIHGLTHLAERGTIDIRADQLMLTSDVTNNGEHTLASAASVIQVGETYISEFETLDLDDLQDPITGLPLQIGGVILRLDKAVQFSFGRRKNELVMELIESLSTEEDWDDTLLSFRGVFSALPFPGWMPDGRIVVRSEDGFPFTVLAVIPQVEAGDLDA